MNSLQKSRQHVLEQIQHACQQAQRDPAEVQLLAVSKPIRVLCCRKCTRPDSEPLAKTIYRKRWKN